MRAIRVRLANSTVISSLPSRWERRTGCSTCEKRSTWLSWTGRRDRRRQSHQYSNVVFTQLFINLRIKELAEVVVRCCCQLAREQLSDSIAKTFTLTRSKSVSYVQCQKTTHEIFTKTFSIWQHWVVELPDIEFHTIFYMFCLRFQLPYRVFFLIFIYSGLSFAHSFSFYPVSFRIQEGIFSIKFSGCI